MVFTPKLRLPSIFKREEKAVEQPDFKTQYPELEEALVFCYALLSPNQPINADVIIEANRERANAAHRAIYNRKPQLEPYDEMMARMRKLDESFSRCG